MAYMNQERKARIAPKVKKILTSYGLVGSLAVRHHSALVLNIRAGQMDFIGNANRKSKADGPNQYGEVWQAKDHIDVNTYHLSSYFTGPCLKCLEELKAAMMEGNWDNSDIQTDYFDIGWYIQINIGQWNKPYRYQPIA